MPPLLGADVVTIVKVKQAIATEQVAAYLEALPTNSTGMLQDVEKEWLHLHRMLNGTADAAGAQEVDEDDCECYKYKI